MKVQGGIVVTLMSALVFVLALALHFKVLCQSFFFKLPYPSNHWPETFDNHIIAYFSIL